MLRVVQILLLILVNTISAFGVLSFMKEYHLFVAKNLWIFIIFVILISFAGVCLIFAIDSFYKRSLKLAADVLTNKKESSNCLLSEEIQVFKKKRRKIIHLLQKVRCYMQNVDNLQ